MNRVAAVVKMHAKGKNAWVIVPWTWILLPAFFVNLLISILITGKIAIYTGGLASIYFYMLGLGVGTVKDTFPLALGLNVRRTDYFLGTGAMVVLVSLAMGLVLFLLSLIEGNLTGGWWVSLHFFNLPYLSTGPLVSQIWTYFVPLVHLYFLGFVSACIWQRYGRNGLYAFLGAATLALTVSAFAASYYQWWGGIFTWFVQHTAAEVASWLLLPTLVCAGVSYLLLRRATV